MEMVEAKVLLFATLGDEYGGELEVKCDGTVRNLIENTAKAVLDKGFLDRVYDVGQNKAREDLIFAINGRNIKDIKGEIEIKEGDTLAIFPLIAGG